MNEETPSFIEQLRGVGWNVIPGSHVCIEVVHMAKQINQLQAKLREQEDELRLLREGLEPKKPIRPSNRLPTKDLSCRSRGAVLVCYGWNEVMVHDTKCATAFRYPGYGVGRWEVGRGVSDIRLVQLMRVMSQDPSVERGVYDEQCNMIIAWTEKLDRDRYSSVKRLTTRLNNLKKSIVVL